MADFSGSLKGLPSVRILLRTGSGVGANGSDATCSAWADQIRERDAMKTLVNHTLFAVAAATLVTLAAPAEAQVVYYSALRPVVAAPVMMAQVMVAPVASAPAYVANYTPAGNYAAVTAFSPPVIGQPTAVAVTSAYAPSAPVATTSFYAPMATPTVVNYAPTVVNYAPTATVAYSPVMAPAVPLVTPVTAYYAPTLYRRGLFGGLRPVRTTAMIPY